LCNTAPVRARTDLRTGTAHAHLEIVARKITLLLGAVLIPGGFIALLAVMLFKQLARTGRGRKVFELARSRVPAWVAGIGVPARQAA
jgi:hypothetical protein